MLTTPPGEGRDGGSTALFALLVAFNNLVDYARTTSSCAIPQHGHDLPGQRPDGAGDHQRALWTIGYWLIILTEAAVGLRSPSRPSGWCRAWGGAPRQFNAAKRYAVLGAGLGFLLWFTGFMVVGGEWFAMWQSKTWNGQEAAFRFYMTLLAVIIFVSQPDGELDT